MSGLCGKIPADIWEYLLNASKQTTDGCNALNLIQYTFQACTPPCGIAGCTMDDVLNRLFAIDSDDNCGIRVIVQTGNTDAPPCSNLFVGREVFWNYIGTATDGQPALLITLSTP